MNKLLILPVFILLMPLIGMRGYYLDRKLLQLIKNIDYEKWQYLMSSSNPLVNRLIGERSILRLNSRRFGKFLREGIHYNSPEVEKCIIKCKRHQKLAILFIILFIASMIALTFPWEQLKSGGYQ